MIGLVARTQRSLMSMRPITAADVMNPRVLAASADWTLPELADFLVEHEISGAPVVDAAGRLVGVVSVTGIAAAMAAAGRRVGCVSVPGRRAARAAESGAMGKGSDFFRSAGPEGPSRETLAGLVA